MDGSEDGRHEWRDVPDGVRAEAAHNPGGSVAAIDGSMVSDPHGYVPPEAIFGVYLVSESGEATGEYVHNPHYGAPIRDDSARLDPTKQYLGWLPGEPFDAVRQGIDEFLTEPYPGHEIEWLKITADPAYRTAGRKFGTDPAALMVTRMALCVEFALGLVTVMGERTVLTGCFSWTAWGLGVEDERRDKTWLDLWAPIDYAAERLESRLMSMH